VYDADVSTRIGEIKARFALTEKKRQKKDAQWSKRVRVASV